ncbi:MAG: single-stranded DNA-binding protein [Bacillota bacterium]
MTNYPIPTVIDVLAKIKAEVEDEEFTLRDLYSTITWNRWDKSERLNLGRFFYHHVKNLQPGDPARFVVPTRKNSAHQQMYKRIDIHVD